MKSFIKLKISYDRGYKRYLFGGCFNPSLSSIAWALDEFHYKDTLIKCLQDPDFDIQGGNEGFIEKVGDKVALYTPHDDLAVEPGEEPTPSAIIDIENLKELVQDWKRLYEKDVPVIYLIVQDNGWVVLQESLNE